jgi:hypothetical protein
MAKVLKSSLKFCKAAVMENIQKIKRRKTMKKIMYKYGKTLIMRWKQVRFSKKKIQKKKLLLLYIQVYS